MFQMNVWQELSKDVGTREVDVHKIIKLANETELDIEELMQVTTSDEDLKELAEQQEHTDDEISFSEDEEEQKELSKKILATMTQITYGSVYTK